MKKLFSGGFAMLGSLLMAATVLLCLFSLNATPKILEFPQDATKLTQDFAAALNRGDLAAAGEYLYGQPELTAGADWADETTAKLWDAYVSSLSCTSAKEPEAQDDGIVWTLRLESMDVAATLDAWQQAVATITAGTDETEEQEEPVSAMEQALTQVLTQPATCTRDITLKLIYRDDRWWIDPDTALMQSLSGQG